ncbi:MAG: hypothetical protein ACE5FJ_03950 [Gemmatimonadales bacterium]
MSGTVSDPDLRDRLDSIRDRLEHQLHSVDPHNRLGGRPVEYRVIAGQTFEVTYREVPRIDEAEVLGVKRIIGEPCYCSVSPQTAENLIVTFVVPLS